MHAALLLVTLLRGAPVLPHTGAHDPAAESGAHPLDAHHLDAHHLDADLHAQADQVLRCCAPLLDSQDGAAYLESLDLAVLELDLRAWSATLGPASLEAIQDPLARAQAIRELVDVVGPSWQPALRSGLEHSFTLLAPEASISLLSHPRVVDGMALLSAEESLDFAELLGAPERSPNARRALLESMRGLLGAGVLAIAANRGTRLPDWLAAAIIPRWRASLHQFRGLLEDLELTPQTERDDIGAVARVLLTYQCRDGQQLAPYFRRDPALASFLGELHDHLITHFPQTTTERFTLAPSLDPDDTTSLPGLEITVFTRHDADAARTALERFDDDWWLEHCNRPPTRIVVDTHLA